VADRENSDSTVPNIVLSTAHPAKFPDAGGEAACGVAAAIAGLARWGGADVQAEQVKIVKNDQIEVERFVKSVSRAAKQGVTG